MDGREFLSTISVEKLKQLVLQKVARGQDRHESAGYGWLPSLLSLACGQLLFSRVMTQNTFLWLRKNLELKWHFCKVSPQRPFLFIRNILTQKKLKLMDREFKMHVYLFQACLDPLTSKNSSNLAIICVFCQKAPDEVTPRCLKYQPLQTQQVNSCQNLVLRWWIRQWTIDICKMPTTDGRMQYSPFRIYDIALFTPQGDPPWPSYR